MPSKITDTTMRLGRIPVPLECHRLEAMYLPIAVEKALTEVCHANKAVTSDAIGGDNLSLLSEVSVYHAFLDKIAQSCDHQRGGDTITAVTVEQAPQGPIFVLAFNRRTRSQARHIADFLRNLLSYVGQNPDNLNSKPLKKRVLWRILLHHVHRLKHYLKGVAKAIHQCIEYCERHGEIEDSETMQKLRWLQLRTEFPRDIWTSDNSQNEFLSNVETLIKAVKAVKVSSLNNTIQRNAMQGQVNESPCWSNLRHFMGRFHSYSQAAEVITSAASRWPELFDNCDTDFRVIRSSKAASNPLHHLTKTSSEVMAQVLSDYDLNRLGDQISRFDAMGLSQEIQEQIHHSKFKPIVHCEILLHSHLIEVGLTRGSDFFRGWKVIGVSKPLCRLCHYYFTGHPDKFRLRAPHPNLYPFWRLPDIYEDQGTKAVEIRNQMMDRIIQSVTQDAVKTLQDKFARRKTHDSNTYTSIPRWHDSDFESESDSDYDSDSVSLESGSEGGVYLDSDDEEH